MTADSRRFTSATNTGYRITEARLNDDAGLYVGGASNPILVGGPAAQGAAPSGNPLLSGGAYNATPATLTTGKVATLQTGSTQSLKVQLMTADSNVALITSNSSADAIATSSSSILNVMANLRQFNGTTWDRWTKPNAVSRLLSAAATTNGTSVKASAGNLYKITGRNAAASIKYLKLYNSASAPSVGSDTPVWTLELPASATFNFDFPTHYFSTGIAYAITGLQADNDTTALSAGDILSLNVEYS